jgi:hypothetical protein
MFIRLVLVGLGVGLISRSSAAVKVSELDDRVRIEIDGRLFTEYRFQHWKFPILYPVIGPNGAGVTRDYPIREGTPNEQQDHEHHRSLWFTHGDVNGVDFWSPQLKKRGHDGHIEHDRIEKTVSGNSQGQIIAWTQWIGDGKPLLRERKHLRIIPAGNGQVLLDYDVELHALDQPVIFGDTDDAGLGIRVASTMKVRPGKRYPDSKGFGTILNSRGDRNGDARATCSVPSGAKASTSKVPSIASVTNGSCACAIAATSCPAARPADPFTGFGEPTFAPIPSSYCPRTAWLMPDGKLRIFSGDIMLSPFKQKRDPLFCWDVDPNNFSVTNQRTILSGRANLGMELPMIGFAKLSPVHNQRQILTFRVTTMNQRQATDRWPAATDHDLHQSGAHHCVIRYDGNIPDTWRFNRR